MLDGNCNLIKLRAKSRDNCEQVACKNMSCNEKFRSIVNNRRNWESIALSDRAVMIRDSAFSAESGTEFSSIFATEMVSDSVGKWEKDNYQVIP